MLVMPPQLFGVTGDVKAGPTEDVTGQTPWPLLVVMGCLRWFLGQGGARTRLVMGVAAPALAVSECLTLQDNTGCLLSWWSWAWLKQHAGSQCTLVRALGLSCLEVLAACGWQQHRLTPCLGLQYWEATPQGLDLIEYQPWQAARRERLERSDSAAR